jgi:hypothetical protein
MPSCDQHSPKMKLAVVIVNRLLTLDDEAPIESVRRLKIVSVGRGHLSRCLAKRHVPEPRTHRGEGHDLDGLLGDSVVRVDGQPSGPGRGLDLVRP